MRRSTPRGRAGSTPTPSSSRPTAAPATPRRSDLPPDRLGRRWRLARRGRHRRPPGRGRAGPTWSRPRRTNRTRSSPCGWRSSAGPTRIVVLGGLGGARLDHALANVGLLADPALRDIPTILLHPRARVSLISAPGPDGRPVRRPLPGPIDGLVSLLPQGDGVVGVTTFGLAYPLADEPLPAGPARGLSNVRVAADAWVEVRAGRLLVVEGPATLSA